jgi:hypothetical protein
MIRITTPTISRTAEPPAADRSEPEQLSLLSPSPLPVQFRLSLATRQRGLAHIAAIRQQLAQPKSAA